MVENIDMKNVVKHLANGSLGDHLCLICLNPLVENNFENIFTWICKDESEYCVANALEALCQIKVDSTENYNICIDCFKAATSAYKFQLQAKQSYEIISFYTNELLNNIKTMELTDEDMGKLLCIPLSSYIPKIKQLDINIEGIGKKDGEKKTVQEDDQKDNIILIVENDKTSYFKVVDGALKKVESDDDDDEDEVVMIVNEKKERKKRDPMTYLTCSRCPIKYRFISKLKFHMKTVHDVEIYFCKRCKIVTENKQNYEVHLKDHKGEHQCTVCSVVYKKAETLASHMKSHEDNSSIPQFSENSNICEVCGAILPDEASLQDHITDKHVKKFTCYYCGKMYKGEGSFELHIKKHELHMAKISGNKSERTIKPECKENGKREKSRAICQTCGKDFVDDRSLLWHQRLHDNDRPFICDKCGRGFVSSARRAAHAVCAHTRPRRRCPLCPALFHLRSMVNTHVKKVHLKAHKRRTRECSRGNVFWRTEAVPLQELSVDVQAQLLDITAGEGALSTTNFDESSHSQPSF